jgi:pyruvate dehydrogenase E1 component beta subunit
MTDVGMTSYGQAIRDGFAFLLAEHDDVFVIGQGLWSPWYVGNSMTDLDKDFGKERVIDTPVAEAACTGIAIGASLCNKRPVVVHPRMDFMVLATDAIVNQAAKWSHMLGGQAHPAVTIRGIINRGGQQGAQHSQALHAWYAHVPGLRVVTPATPKDARDLLIASVLCDDPVVYIDDRWLYEQEEGIGDPEILDLESVGPELRREGADVSLVASGYSVVQALDAASELSEAGISAEVVDLRVLNPMKWDVVVNSVRKTGRLVAIDGGWSSCGVAAEVIAAVAERLHNGELRAAPARVTLTDTPAPTSGPLEEAYYTSVPEIVATVRRVTDASR